MIAVVWNLSWRAVFCFGVFWFEVIINRVLCELCDPVFFGKKWVWDLLGCVCGVR